MQRGRRGVWCWVILLCISLLGCTSAADVEENPASPPQTPPFQADGGLAVLSDAPPAAGGPPPSRSCAPGDLRRCRGDTVQQCNPFTLLWEDTQVCSAFGERCSARLEECFGLVGWACCTL